MFKSSYLVITKLALAVTTLLMLGSCAESPTGRPQLMLFDNTQVSKMGIQTQLSLSIESVMIKKAQHVMLCVAFGSQVL